LSDYRKMVGGVLEWYGYDIRSSDAHGLTALKERRSLRALVFEGPTDSNTVLKEMGEEEADSYLLVALGGVSGLQDLPPSVMVWGRRELEMEIGKATLASIEGISGGELFDQLPTQPESRVHLVLEDNDELAGERIIKPVLSLDRVAAKTGKEIGAFKYTLELIPYYVFDYSCDLEAQGWMESQCSSGSVSVNGLTSKPETWRKGYTTISELDGNHTKLEPRIPVERAREIAYERALQVNTTEIEDVMDRGTVTIYEKRRVRPVEGSLKLRARGLVYLPLWSVEGSHGNRIVNAVTGDVVKESRY